MLLNYGEEEEVGVLMEELHLVMERAEVVGEPMLNLKLPVSKILFIQLQLVVGEPTVLIMPMVTMEVIPHLIIVKYVHILEGGDLILEEQEQQEKRLRVYIILLLTMVVMVLPMLFM
jgi:hypothetical protein